MIDLEKLGAELKQYDEMKAENMRLKVELDSTRSALKLMESQVENYLAERKRLQAELLELQDKLYRIQNGPIGPRTFEVEVGTIPIRGDSNDQG